MYSIILIGAGQLGSRHLQALSRSSLSLHIDVVDPAQDALDIAAARYAEMPQGDTSVSYYTDIPSEKGYGVAVIATSSGVRADVTRALIARCSVRYIIFEKVLFSRLEEYDAIESLLRQKNIRAWVNCPRRMYPLTQDIKELVQGGPLLLTMQGGMWGLGCNAIHAVDLLACLTGELEFAWDTTYLDPMIHASPRAGYDEFSGLLLARSTDGASRLVLHAQHRSAAPATMHIITETVKIDLDEASGTGTLYRLDTGWKPEPLSYRIPYQSELTQLVVESLMLQQATMLTTYEDSCVLHKNFIHTLCEFGKLHNVPAINIT